MLIEFCLPVYNEERILKNNILKLLEYCQAQNYNFDWKIVIIVNGSSDQSLPISEELSKIYANKIKTINIKQSGKGRAIKSYGLKSKADIFVYMDVDLAVSLDNISQLINPIINNKADLVIGSRLLPDSKIKRSFIRELSSQTYNFCSRMILKHRFSDLQCGFKAARIDVCKKVIPHIKDDNWFFDTELVFFAHYFKFLIKEIPVDWSENRYEQRKSKVNLFRDGIKFILNLLKLKVRIRQDKF